MLEGFVVEMNWRVEANRWNLRSPNNQAQSLLPGSGSGVGVSLVESLDLADLKLILQKFEMFGYHLSDPQKLRKAFERLHDVGHLSLSGEHQECPRPELVKQIFCPRFQKISGTASLQKLESVGRFANHL